MRRILVTGGSGLVGKALQRFVLTKDSHDVWMFLSSKDGDLRCRDQTMTIFDKFRPTHVIHLAAMVGGLYKNESKIVQMFTDNVRINENVLEAANLFNVDRGIFTLSNCMFPHDIDESLYPLDETMIHSGPVHPSYEGYAYAKRMLDIQCRNYNKYCNRKYVCILPVNIYGKEDNFNIGEAHLIPALIHKCFLAMKNNTDFVVYGTGCSMRQFIYVDDLADIIYRLIIDKHEGNSYICLSDEMEYTIAQLAELIAKIFDYSGNIVYDTTMSDGQLRKPVTNKKMLNHPLFRNYIGTLLDDGLRETIKWFCNNYDDVRK